MAIGPTVIPDVKFHIGGRAQREPGIQSLLREIPGSSLGDAPE
jgi:hypothetical protein